MTKLKTNIFGEPKILEHQASHFICESFDEFFIAEYPDTVLGSMIKLSIGLETFIKKMLEEKDSLLIYTKIRFSDWEKINKDLLKLKDRKSQRLHILSEFKNKNQSTDKTVDFSIAIELFKYFFRVNKNIINDLHDVRNYRNGLFHWKAKENIAFSLSKQSVRLFEWVFKYLEKKIGWWLGDELTVIDPMGEKRKKLAQLKKYINNENGFNLQRRIFKHNKEYGIYFRAKSRLDGHVCIKDAKIWKQKCPACNYEELQIYGGGSNKSIYASCIRCDFSCSDKEYDSIKPKSYPSMGKVLSTLQ